MFIISRFVLMGYNLIRMIIVGFGLMAVYYAYMILFVSVQGETADFLLPMFIYGVATGILFVPIVSFAASSAPSKIAVNASLIGIFSRFIGFTASLALNNELQLFTKSSVREKVRESLTETSAQLPVTLLNIQNQYINSGSDMYTSKTVSSGYFNQMIGQQILARAIRDYCDLMLTGLIFVIIILLLLPQIQHVVLRLRKGNVPY
jgi:hypothetical protein